MHIVSGNTSTESNKLLLPISNTFNFFKSLRISNESLKLNLGFLERQGPISGIRTMLIFSIYFKGNISLGSISIDVRLISKNFKFLKL